MDTDTQCGHKKCPAQQDKTQLAYNHLSVRRADTLLSLTQTCVAIYTAKPFKSATRE